MGSFLPNHGTADKATHHPANSMQKKVYHAIRWMLGLIFIYASYDKILHPQAFALMVHNYQLLPGELVNLTALVLPWLELILGGCLITDRLMPGTVIISNLLLFTFTIILFYNVHRGLDINCGCFSTAMEDNPATRITIVRDGIFLMMSLYLYWFTFTTSDVHQ